MDLKIKYKNASVASRRNSELLCQGGNTMTKMGQEIISQHTLHNGEENLFTCNVAVEGQTQRSSH